MGNSNDEAWSVLDAVRQGLPVTNGQVQDALATLGLCLAPSVPPLESESFTTLVSLLSGLTSALVGQTQAINRMLEMDDMADEPQGLNPRR